MIAEKTVMLRCLNGPLENTLVESPADLFQGRAVALPWTNIQGEARYPVYVIVLQNDEFGLMFIRTYDTPDRAAAKVDALSYVAYAVNGARPQ